MASRLGVSRATTHIQLRFPDSQGLVTAGVVRQRRAPTKDSTVDLHTNVLPDEQLPYLRRLHYLQSFTVYYNIHACMQRDYHVQLARHFGMNQSPDYTSTHFDQGIISYCQLHSKFLDYMPRVIMQATHPHAHALVRVGSISFLRAAALSQQSGGWLFHYY